MKDSPHPGEGDTPQVWSHLRALTHDLSNAVEIILQAVYLLKEAQSSAPQKLTHLIEKAADDAARINREIQETLRSRK
jgi:hypothetical protein